jgi:hypothetical protein
LIPTVAVVGLILTVGGERVLWLWRVLRLEDVSWSFLVFFSHDDIFMAVALALWVLVVCAGHVARVRQLIKPWGGHRPHRD